jgi:hydroxyacylglutathione hydrolase
MTEIFSFTFNPFQENTYIVASSKDRTCWIIDPGCYGASEQQQLLDFISRQQLVPKRLLNTHCHLDHIFGNALIADNYGLAPEWHPKEDVVMSGAALAAMMYGVKAPEYRAPGNKLQENTSLLLGGAAFRILFTPGHSPGSVCFYNEAEGYVIVGDVLFQGSIGRTDLPGGNYDTLIHSIRSQLLTLPDEVVVYNGHGPSTTIGEERRGNPFLR